ncbi:prepilin-type N-terminal cleavage/methylation domain-containing protein [Halomonas sp. ATCH28]|uniref:Prepilin-type N-terminal cleavage/methylation domain-containing protein n=1 Tax=Halomonas gemina TaxID=2945105 RepID=A0ABT0T5B4_9GAMM|nr:prepilin-type N-terminal cleavage/methylation domain-containing protein [Halomonas gemina]MCL7942054.1 prepilin-type N-terminal cleavage/methylation domain-containing protein [Halomonas gemina]
MKRNSGFSLVELMVALVIGLIIILGAGQLFLTVFQTNRQVETLSEKQAAVNFAVETLLRDIRRADWSKTSPAPGEGSSSVFEVTVPNRDECSGGDNVEKVYSLASRTVDNTSKYYLQVSCGGGVDQEIVGGIAENGFNVTPVGDYGVLVTLMLVPTDAANGGQDSLVFHAVNRTAAVTP